MTIHEFDTMTFLLTRDLSIDNWVYKAIDGHDWLPANMSCGVSPKKEITAYIDALRDLRHGRCTSNDVYEKHKQIMRSLTENGISVKYVETIH